MYVYGMEIRYTDMDQVVQIQLSRPKQMRHSDADANMTDGEHTFHCHDDESGRISHTALTFRNDGASMESHLQ